MPFIPWFQCFPMSVAKQRTSVVLTYLMTTGKETLIICNELQSWLHPVSTQDWFSDQCKYDKQPWAEPLWDWHWPACWHQLHCSPAAQGTRPHWWRRLPGAGVCSHAGWAGSRWRRGSPAHWPLPPDPCSTPCAVRCCRRHLARRSAQENESGDGKKGERTEWGR